MARDLPDWGALSAQETVHEVTDLGELAVRLGSIVSFDRRGDVLWLDEFECGLGKWYTFADGGGASVALSTDYCRNGETSCLLTGGSTSSFMASLSRWQVIPVLSTFGLEASFALATTIDTLEFDLEVYDGVNWISYSVRWRDAENDLQYEDADGNWVTFASGVNLYKAAGLFHTVKLVVETLNNNYERLIVDDVMYPLTGIPARRVDNPTRPAISPAVVLLSRDGENDKVYIDDVILTQNEPLNP